MAEGNIIYFEIEETIGDPPRRLHSCALPADFELDELARQYNAYKKIKLLSVPGLMEYELDCLSFEQYILLFTPKPGRDWAYTDNRMSSMQRRKNGHRS